MTPWGVVNRKVFGPHGPSLTNRMSEMLTYGSVGGVGRKPGPYPAANAGERFQFRCAVQVHWPGVAGSLGISHAL